jgi:hypothetical protein
MTTACNIASGFPSQVRIIAITAGSTIVDVLLAGSSVDSWGMGAVQIADDIIQQVHSSLAFKQL